VSTEPFPVVDERPLLPPQRRWLRAWRDPALLPAQPPGCVYVFASDDRYTPCRDARLLRGTEPELVEARWVSVVNVRHRRIVATTWVPAKNPADDFVVRAVFGCGVVRPEIVAELGLTDLQRDLDIRLRLDEQLVRLQHMFDVEQIGEARAAVATSLGETYQRQPPAVPGMYIRLEGVHVNPPRALRDHHTELRDTMWSWEVETLRAAYELDRVKHVEELLKTPERAEAAAVARKETTTREVAEREFRERDTRTQRLIDQVEKWIDSDGGKRAPIDRRHLAEQLFEQLTDKPTPQPAELAHTNGHVADGPLIPPADSIDGI
jgi:hypothetical protein